MVVLTTAFFLVFDLCQRLQTLYVYRTSVASPFDVAPIDKILWKEPPWNVVTLGLSFAARFVRYGFLIYLGFHTKWYFPVILYAATFLTTNFGISFIRLSWGLRMPVAISVIVMPIVGTLMWLAVP